MKRNDIKTLRALSINELQAKEMEIRQQLFSQSLQQATKPVKDNQSGKKLRRDIARIMTFIQQKRAEEGY